jgi:hypothetical protein
MEISMEETHSRSLNEEQIRELVTSRAYELYEQRACEPGRAIEDWLQAENEVAAYPAARDTLPPLNKPAVLTRSAR